MKQKVKGKIFVGMIISILAFGFATGTGIFIGTNPLSTAGILDLTKQGEFPNIYTEPSNISTSQNKQNNNTKVYIEPKTTPNTSKNSSNTPPKTNTTTNSSG